MNTSLVGFNGLMSPTKGRPSKAPRLTPLTVSDSTTTGMIVCYVYLLFICDTIGVNLPSPQLGSSFTFPPITPTALIAPINLPGKLDVIRMLIFDN